MVENMVNILFPNLAEDTPLRVTIKKLPMLLNIIRNIYIPMSHQLSKHVNLGGIFAFQI
jgi:hypothetical protein